MPLAEIAWGIYYRTIKPQRKEIMMARHKNLSTFTDQGKLYATKDSFGTVTIRQVEGDIDATIILDNRELRLLIDRLIEIHEEIN
jgi:hypothetical protein